MKLIPTYGIVNAGDRNGSPGAQGDLAAEVRLCTWTSDFNLVPIELAEKDIASLVSATGDGLRAATTALERFDTQGIATLAAVTPDSEGRDLELRLLGATVTEAGRLAILAQERIERPRE